MSGTVSTGDLARLVSGIGAWITGSVAASPTPTTTQFAVTGYDFTAAPSLAGALVIVGQATRRVGQIASNSGATLTLSTALASAPAVGDPVLIFPEVSVNFSGAENIAEVGGQAVPADFSGNARVPVTEYNQQVFNGTIASTQTGFLASGDEAAYLTLTVNGTYRVNGALYLSSLIVNLGGRVIVGPTGQITTGAF
jgi:hypothetical protein